MRAIITAGGTGGHIYPALAIANKIKNKEPKSEIIYIGTHNRMEKDIVPKHGIKFIPLEVYGFAGAKIYRNFQNLFLLRKAYKKCLGIMREFKPDVVIGAGGYVAYPVIKAAHKLNIKTFIHEQNAIPGKSNKALTKYATVIGVSFNETKKHFKKNTVYVTGNPCSENAIKMVPMKRSEFGLRDDKKLVMVVAGSLGSPALNDRMKEFITSSSTASYQLLYITGKEFYDDFTKDFTAPKNVIIVPYIENLTKMLKVTDLVISRAGASTISELIALNIPTIYVPSPHVPNNHQYFNALKLKEAGAGILIEEKDLNADELRKTVDEILNDKKAYLEMKRNLSKMAITDSSEKIYNIIKDMIA